MRSRSECSFGCRSSLVGSVVLLALLALSPLRTTATSMPVELNFSSTPVGSTTSVPGGTVSYQPGVGQVLTVTDAPIVQVVQLPGGVHEAITGGSLDVTTGGCEAGCSFSSKQQQTQSFFSDGGTIKIFGSLPEFANDPHGLLFSGTFDQADGSTIFGEANCPQTNTTLSMKGGSATGGLDGCVDVTGVNAALLQDLGFTGERHRGSGTWRPFSLIFHFPPRRIRGAAWSPVPS